MSSKSKSPLFTIVGIAIILFISAIIWKNTRIDNSEDVYETPFNPRNNLQPTILNPNINTKEHVVNESNIYTDEINKAYITPQESVKNINSKLNKALMYKTPEKVIEAIEHYESIGNIEKANEFVQYLTEAFPEYSY